jgi:hypothetical protein
VYTFSANEYMVVRRDQSQIHVAAAAQAEATAQQALASAKASSDALEAANKPWRATLMAGVGSDGQSVEHVTNEVHVNERKAFVYGGQLARKVYKDFSVSGTILSNQTYTLGVGLDFK